jgi:hypothetical protein
MICFTMCTCISPDLDGHVALKMEQRRVLVRFLARGVKVSLYTNVGEYCPCFITHPRVNPN